jgi:hypothetical protein
MDHLGFHISYKNIFAAELKQCSFLPSADVKPRSIDLIHA